MTNTFETPHSFKQNLYPFDSKFHRIEGAFDEGRPCALHYIDEHEVKDESKITSTIKKGTVVMVHGNPTWSFYYRHLVKALRKEYRVIAFDHMGCGFSSKPQNYSYTFEQRVKDMDNLLEALCANDGANDGALNIVGHDWGGAIATAWAVRNPTKVKSMTLMNTAAFGLPEQKSLPWQIGLVKHGGYGGIKAIGKYLAQGLNLFLRGTTEFCSTKPLSSDVIQGYLAPYQNWNSRRSIYEFINDIPLNEHHGSFEFLQETTRLLKNIKDKPMFLGWGLKDFVFDGHFLAEWLKHFPEAKVVSFEEGHHLILEDEKDALIAEIRHFLT